MRSLIPVSQLSLLQLRLTEFLIRARSRPPDSSSWLAERRRLDAAAIQPAANLAFSSSSSSLPDSLLCFPWNRNRHGEFTRRFALPEMKTLKNGVHEILDPAEPCDSSSQPADGNPAQRRRIWPISLQATCGLDSAEVSSQHTSSSASNKRQHDLVRGDGRRDAVSQPPPPSEIMFFHPNPKKNFGAAIQSSALAAPWCRREGQR